MKNQQSGFGVAPLLLAIIAIGIVGFVGWRIYDAQKGNNPAPVTNTPVREVKESDPIKGVVPEGYKLYKDAGRELSFAYPQTWLAAQGYPEDSEAGILARLVSPEQNEHYEEHKRSQKQTDGPSSSDLAVSYWKDINNRYAKGGEWLGQKHYANLEEYFSDTYEGRPKQKVGEKIINGQKIYEVTISDHGSSYGIMIERQDGIYQLEFPAIWDKSQITPETQKIVDSIKFE